MNRLNQQICYLAGAIDRVSDRGIGWRDEITPFLEQKGIVVYNPLKKTCQIGIENKQTHILKNKLKKEQKYNELSALMKEIRAVDLRLIDKSDFLIVNLNLNTHPCGTYEEIFTANRAKRPILIHIEQGKEKTPDWLFGTIPHEMFFSNFDDLKNYLNNVDKNENINSYNRWKFLTNFNT